MRPYTPLNVSTNYKGLLPYKSIDFIPIVWRLVCKHATYPQNVKMESISFVVHTLKLNGQTDSAILRLFGKDDEEINEAITYIKQLVDSGTKI